MSSGSSSEARQIKKKTGCPAFITGLKGSWWLRTLFDTALLLFFLGSGVGIGIGKLVFSVFFFEDWWTHDELFTNSHRF